MKKLVLHSKFKIGGSSQEYIEMERTVELSDNAVLTPGMVIVKGDLRVTLDEIVWDDDRQEYVSYIPAYNIAEKHMLKQHIGYALGTGWQIRYMTEGLREPCKSKN